MPLHHYLPAAYIGQFSTVSTGKSRNRKIFVGDKTAMSIFESTPKNICAEIDFYKLYNDSDFNQIDELWKGYESDLPGAIDALVNQTIDAYSWANILVPFVTCLMVRTPDFNDRFEKRIDSFGARNFNDNDNTNKSRILEIQRLIGQLTIAEWRVCSVLDTTEYLIGNDIGYCYFLDNVQSLGIAIPLNKSHILQIVPKLARNIAIFKYNNWFPEIKYLTLEKDNYNSFNASINFFARRHIFGHCKSIINDFLTKETVSAPLGYAPVGLMNSHEARIHEFTWHRVISILTKTPDNIDKHDFGIDYRAVKNSWLNHIIFPIDQLIFPDSIKIHENSLNINLS